MCIGLVLCGCISVGALRISPPNRDYKITAQLSGANDVVGLGGEGVVVVVGGRKKKPSKIKKYSSFKIK